MISSPRLGRLPWRTTFAHQIRGLSRRLPAATDIQRTRLLARVWWPFEAGNDLPALYARDTKRDFPAYVPDRSTTDLAIMLQRVQRRVQIQRLLILAARTVWLALLATFVLMLARFITVVPWAVIAAAIGLIIALAVVYHRIHPVTLWTTARLLDRHQRLAEQIATALELGLASAPPRLAARQILTAVHTARELGATRRFRPQVPWLEIQVAFSLALLVAGLSLFGGPAERLTPPASPMAPTDTSATDLSELGVIDPSVVGDLASVYDGATDEMLSNPYSSEDYPLGDFNSEELRQAAERSARSAQELEQIAEALKDASITNQAAQEIQAGNYEAAAQQIAELAKNVDSLSPEARQDLAARLQQAAQNIQPMDPEMANRLEQAAKALASRSDRAATQGLEDVSKAISETGQNVISQAQLAQAMQEAGELGPPLERSSDTGSPGEGSGSGEDGAQPMLGEGDAGQFGFESAESTLGLGSAGMASTQAGAGGAGAGTGQGTDGDTPSPSTNPNSERVEVTSDQGDGPLAPRPGQADPGAQDVIIAGPGTTGPGNVPQSDIPITTGLDPNLVPRNLRNVVEGYFRAQK